MRLPGIDRLSSIKPVAVFLESSHSELAKQVESFCKHELSNETEAQSDKEVRSAARQWLKLVGAKGVLAPLAVEDLRGLCLTRETIASYSPLVDTVVAIQALVATSLQLAGSKEQQESWLNGIVTGRIMSAFAMTEPEAGSDVAAISTTAAKDTNGWVLNGQKHLISNAGIADVYLVFAATTLNAGSHGLSAFLVPSNTQGLVYTGAQITAAGHPLGQISLEDCHVPSDALLGSLNGGFKLGMMTLDRLRPSVGAAACGMASRALVESLQHVTSRHQFGEPLASFQLIREKIGRMATLLEAARLLVYRAAWCHDHGKRITLEAAMAKSFSTETAQSIVDESLQIAGGLGVVVGHPIERLYRAVRALRIYEGTTEIQRLIIAGELLGTQPLAKRDKQS